MKAKKTIESFAIEKSISVGLEFFHGDNINVIIIDTCMWYFLQKNDLSED